MTCILIEGKNLGVLLLIQLTMKYRFGKLSSVSENFLLDTGIQKSTVVKTGDRFQKTSNTRKQVEFDAFTSRQPSQFELVMRDTVSTDEIMPFVVERVLHRADSASKKRRGKNEFRTREREDKRDRKNNRGGQASMNRDVQATGK